MASTRDLRRRIRSIKNTSQITKAMQMVSATKMKRAQSQAFQGRPYTQTLLISLSRLAKNNGRFQHQLMNSNDSKKVGIVVLSSDKGLCGALNTNLFRYIHSSLEFNRITEGKEVVFFSVGKKGRDYIARTGRGLEADFENQEKVGIESAVSLRKFLVRLFLTVNVNEVYLLYPDFVSALKQEPKLIKLLPVDLNDLIDQVNTGLLENSEEKETDVTDSSMLEFLFEPEKNMLLDYSLLHLIDIRIYQAFLETKASEHSARMIAMQNATDNASELVDDLTLTYNQIRQENITKELLEITSAGAALE